MVLKFISATTYKIWNYWSPFLPIWVFIGRWPAVADTYHRWPIRKEENCQKKGSNQSKFLYGRSKKVEMILKKETNEFYFTTMKLQVDLFFGMKTPKRHFKIKWPLVSSYLTKLIMNSFNQWPKLITYILLNLYQDMANQN